PRVQADAGVCLLMHDVEPLKPSNTGWLIADLLPDTFAFGWSRTEVDPALLQLLADPQWQPYVVFPGEYVEPQRVLHSLPTERAAGKQLFILLDASWCKERRMCHNSPSLERFPALRLQTE